MLLTYTKYICWHKTISDDPLFGISKSNQKRLRSTLSSLPSNLNHEIIPVNDTLLAWFMPLYNQTISNKNNPIIIDIQEVLNAQKKQGKEYYMIILSEGNKKIGATIFSTRKNFLSIAYRIYPHQWETFDTAANPSLYSEYLICQHASKLGYNKLSHGKDRNLYGHNSSIGLAIFKLSVGCKAYTNIKDIEIKTLETEMITEDLFVVNYDSKNTFLNKAYLICLKNNEEKYVQITKYPNLSNVKTIYRD